MDALTEPALRFAHYALLLGLFGWSAFRLVSLRQLFSLHNPYVPQLALIAAAAAPLLSGLLMLSSIATMMGLPISALDWRTINGMLLGTDMGSAFLVRSGLLAFGLTVLLVLGRRNSGLALAAACYSGALLTLGWSGHAAATDGSLGILHRANNGLHLMAAGLWLGAIGWFLALTIQCHKRTDELSAQVVLKAMHSFARLGVTLVALVVLTGLVNANLIFGLPNSMAILGTPYGAMLAGKVSLVIAMLAFAAHNARISKDHHETDLSLATPRPNQILGRLWRSLAAELLLGLGVIGLVAILGTISPLMG